MGTLLGGAKIFLFEVSRCSDGSFLIPVSLLKVRVLADVVGVPVLLPFGLIPLVALLLIGIAIGSANEGAHVPAWVSLSMDM